jgi:enoyl-CoA hydratase
MAFQYLLIDDPAPKIRRITLNRPEKRNALNEELLTEIPQALLEADRDPSISVTILRANGPSFCAGHDLTPRKSSGYEQTTDAGTFPRARVSQHLATWDLAKPVIAQVHGHCLAGGSELATGCDLVYVSDDAKIGYPAVRFGVPDMQYHAWLMGMRKGMELMLTGDSMTGLEAVEYQFANRSYPADELEAAVLAMAQRIALIPTDVLQINKRTIHRAMEHMGMRDGLRAGTDLCALGVHTDTMKEFIGSAGELGLTKALTKRDAAFGDGRIATGSAARV